jgi:hypothetical protein
MKSSNNGDVLDLVGYLCVLFPIPTFSVNYPRWMISSRVLKG